MFLFIAKLRAVYCHHFLNLFDHGPLFLMKTLGASVLRRTLGETLIPPISHLGQTRNQVPRERFVRVLVFSDLGLEPRYTGAHLVLFPVCFLQAICS